MNNVAKQVVALLCALSLLAGAGVAKQAGGVTKQAKAGVAKQNAASELSFRLTEGRQVFTQAIGGGLLLRVVKERSTSQRDFGWRVEVVSKPHLRSSRNLLYHSRRTLGAHPSQVYAWHVTTGEFPNVRVLGVLGRPVNIRIELLDPVAEGDGPDSKFVSGELKISWGI